MPLSAIQVSKATPGDKPYKLTDGSGLYLLVKPDGGRYWRLDYRVFGKRKTLALKGVAGVLRNEAQLAASFQTPLPAGGASGAFATHSLQSGLVFGLHERCTLRRVSLSHLQRDQ